MSSAYITKLQREQQAEAANESPAAPVLRERFLDWYAAVPEIARQRAFAMGEFEQALGTQGRYLSPILLSLGWRRKRRWTGAGQYNRYWVPPGLS